MKRRLFKLMLTIVCLLSSLNISAYDFEVDGLYYDVVSFPERTCSLVGTGGMTDVVIPAHVSYSGETLTVVSIGITCFSSYLESISIPNTVTSLSDRIFDDCKSLERVRIEDGEETLSLGCNRPYGQDGGEGLFYDCPIKSLYIGRNLSYKYWGDSPFAHNADLQSVEIGNSVTSIGSSAFYYCSGLTSIVIPNSVTSIGSHAFYYCSGLKSIEIGNSVTSIGSQAFDGCSALTIVNIHDIAAWCNIQYSVYGVANPIVYASNLYLNGEKVTELVIPNSVTSIGRYAFYGCSGLTSVVIPNSVKSIGDCAFSGCSGLTSVDIPNSVVSIGSSAFYGCSTLTMVNIHDIDAWCNIYFSNQTSNPIHYADNLYLDGEKVTELVIPNSVTSIGRYAFYGCSGLTSVIIPNSVTSIGVGAFHDCSALTDLTVGSSVKRIDGDVFLYGCDALTNLYMLNPVPVSIEDNFFTNNQYMTLNVFVPEEAVSAYQSADGWKNFCICKVLLQRE